MADWLKGGDKNIKIFHAKSSLRRRKNLIKGIKDNLEIWLEDMGDIESKLCDYFQGFFHYFTTKYGSSRGCFAENEPKS